MALKVNAKRAVVQKGTVPSCTFSQFFKIISNSIVCIADFINFAIISYQCEVNRLFVTYLNGSDR